MAEAVYLERGEGMVGNLLAMLRSNGLALERAESVLDFACGHGRVTCWLVDMCGAERVTTSDINPQAVDFVCKTLKVARFYSTQEADDLTHDRKYHVIFVASLAIQSLDPEALERMGCAARANVAAGRLARLFDSRHGSLCESSPRDSARLW
jgi:hypothetical protein